MAGGPGEPVASGAMEISPGLDARPGTPRHRARRRRPPAAPVEPDEEITAEQMSLSRRLRQPRTIISILIPLVIIAAFVGINGAALAKVPGLIAGANPVLVLAAFLVFYAGLPAARLALGDPAARHRLQHRRPRTRPRSSSCPGWSTASCRPSSATSTAPICSRSTARRR